MDAALSRSGAVQSVDRSLALLEALTETSGGLGVAELARRTGTPQGTVHRLLATLLRRGWVHQRADRRYVLGARLIQVGAAAGRLLGSAVRPYLAELVTLSGESANLAVLEGDRVAYLAQVSSPHRLRMFAEPGNRVPAHSTGVGKLLLADLPTPVVDALVARTGLPARTTTTITDAAALHAELARVREQGFAVDLGEEEQGVRCVAVGVRGPDGRTLAALSVSGPEVRMGSVDTGALVQQMLAVAGRVEQLPAVTGQIAAAGAEDEGGRPVAAAVPLR